MLPMTMIIVCNFEDNSCFVFYYVLQICGLFTQLITLVGFDGLFFTLLFCGYIELEQIKNALVNLDRNGKAGISDEKLLQQTIEIVEHHNFVLDFPPSTSNLIRGGPYALSALCQILIYSAVGEKIVEQTEDIAQVAYEVDWYTCYRPKLRKMLSLIMHRSQKASQITAGGVWYLNMNTFGQV
ncbi:odorant receptor [Holotrichia oblita]|uniref:Odorant receptor n=1 Tax=Holotrichia oblita TaxID=644536 RepID=A0ACB9TA77_HOLOL|nr:odorant receptor [Holotrichia oblita]